MDKIYNSLIEIDCLSSRLHIANCTLSMAIDSVQASYNLRPVGEGLVLGHDVNTSVLSGVLLLLGEIEKEMDELTSVALAAARQEGTK